MPRRNASNCPPVLTYAAVYSRTSLLYWDSALSGELDRELLVEESDDDSDPFELAENEQAWVRTSIATSPPAGHDAEGGDALSVAHELEGGKATT